MIRNWAGNVTFSTDLVHRPTSVAQVQELVSAHPRVHALGTGHSFNRIADTTGVLVNVQELDGTVEFGTDTVSLPAGMRYGELAGVLETHGRALHNLGSLPHISVAGACATGTHGSGERNGNLATAVRAVEFVSGDGEVVRVRSGEPDFEGTVLALGALGIVTRMSLATEPSYSVRQNVWLDLPFASLVENLDEILGAGYSVSVFTSWQRPDVIEQVWVKVRGDTSEAAAPERWGARLADAPQHPILGADAAAATEQLGAPGAWHERLPHFRLAFTPSFGDELQSEFFVPRASGPDALVAVRGVAERIAPALLVCELRAIAADDLWLSPMRDRDCLGVHFTWRPEVEAALAAVRIVEAALEPYDPRPHWGKVFYRPPTSEGLPQFRALIDRYDPDRSFANDYLERYVY